MDGTQSSNTRDVGAELTAAVDAGSVEIPPVPALALKLQEALASDGTPLEELVRLIGLDQRLATDVLRAANAAVFGGKVPAISTEAALRRLGTTSVACIAYQATLGGFVRAAGPLARERRSVWLEAVVSAAVARALAGARGGVNKDEAFLCGIVHDFGKVVALGWMEKNLEDELDDPADLEMIADKHHVALGAGLADKWNLPRAVRDVIAHHHDGGGPANDPMIDLVRAADRVTQMLIATHSVSAADVIDCGAARTQKEADAVAKALLDVPPLVADFCDAQALKRIQAIAPADAGLMIPAAVTGGSGGARPATCIALVDDKLTMRSPQALPESWAARITLSPPGKKPFELWALVKKCAPSAGANGGFIVEAQPFALSGELKKQWYAFVVEMKASSRS